MARVELIPALTPAQRAGIREQADARLAAMIADEERSPGILRRRGEPLSVLCRVASATNQANNLPEGTP